ncbi:c-type cytochrome [Acetobacter estunensis]|uniref:C-type cytochrome n=1 Tax=Acetobacter estunensis TaxID=104097 RepID=A0A967B9Z8_9PROT|nr:c-type cytochrome [Acetobacter estunensis]NHO53163.1 c-type cytochrome [Acetobacter estunensis]
MDFSTANRGAFALLLVACAMGVSWMGGALAIPPLSATAPAQAASSQKEDATPLPAGDPNRGMTLATESCAACHSLTPGVKDSVGPELSGVFGRKIGSLPDYPYSQALHSQNGTWDEAALNRWLRDPATFAPGTRMSFPGLPSAADRADIIAWLKDRS